MWLTSGQRTAREMHGRAKTAWWLLLTANVAGRRPLYTPFVCLLQRQERRRQRTTSYLFAQHGNAQTGVTGRTPLPFLPSHPKLSVCLRCIRRKVVALERGIGPQRCCVCLFPDISSRDPISSLTILQESRLTGAAQCCRG